MTVPVLLLRTKAQANRMSPRIFPFCVHLKLIFWFLRPRLWWITWVCLRCRRICWTLSISLSMKLIFCWRSIGMLARILISLFSLLERALRRAQASNICSLLLLSLKSISLARPGRSCRRILRFWSLFKERININCQKSWSYFIFKWHKLRNNSLKYKNWTISEE
jgi:hypothetical protein